jgi:dTDP-4-amino-4,6-dideoxygalactose transaminase
MNVPFLSFSESHSEIYQEMLSVFKKVYTSNRFVLGSEVDAFEKAYASMNQTKFCVGVSNGLDALILSLRVLGIGEGDEVIVPSNTYIATALAVSQVGAIPIFVEPKIESYNINPELIPQAISKRTKAIIPVHLYGQSCEMDRIMEIAKKFDLFIIEDNAQGHLSSFKGKLTGSFGHVNATSFYPGKNLGALGDAGAITTDSDFLAKNIQILRNYGSNKKYYNEVLGFNNRLDELQAAFLSEKLKYLEKWTLERQKIAAFYNENLIGVGDLILPKIAKSTTHSFHLYVIRSKRRNQLKTFLDQKGIETMIHYPIPPHLQEAYHFLNLKKGDFPISEEIAETCLSLPIWPGMAVNEKKEVVKYLQEFFSKTP